MQITALRKEVEEADEKLETSTTTLNRVRVSAIWPACSPNLSLTLPCVDAGILAPSSRGSRHQDQRQVQGCVRWYVLHAPQLLSALADLLGHAALGLLGEIQLGKHDDYAQWGIEILVSFRDKEPLKVLTSHRQSGGVSAETPPLFGAC